MTFNLMANNIAEFYLYTFIDIVSQVVVYTQRINNIEVFGQKGLPLIILSSR